MFPGFSLQVLFWFFFCYKFIVRIFLFYIASRVAILWKKIFSKTYPLKLVIGVLLNWHILKDILTRIAQATPVKIPVEIYLLYYRIAITMLNVNFLEHIFYHSVLIVFDSIKAFQLSPITSLRRGYEGGVMKVGLWRRGYEGGVMKEGLWRRGYEGGLWRRGYEDNSW